MSTTQAMCSPNIHFEVLEGKIAQITVDRPERHNAMTESMYLALLQALAACRADAGIRCAILRGAGGKSFVAGTDISHFANFATGEDGIRYENFVESVMDAVERLGVPTIAVIDGWAVGGGLALATACDFRICSEASKFGAPIAKTLSNTLSSRNMARLCSAFGAPRVKRMLMLSEYIDAAEAKACGYVYSLVETAAITDAALALARRLTPLSAVTQSAVKEGLRRMIVEQRLDDDDLIREVYGSQSFRMKVAAYLAD